MLFATLSHRVGSENYLLVVASLWITNYQYLMNSHNIM